MGSITQHGGDFGGDSYRFGSILQQFRHNPFTGNDVTDPDMVDLEQPDTDCIGKWLGLIDYHHGHTNQGDLHGHRS
jgi:hypothetical protein